MSMTQRELIDYCNGKNGSCSDDCPYDTRECNVFLAKYKCTPYLREDRPELYSDDVIEAEPNMTLKESDNKMDKGDKIAYAIFKEVSRLSFYDWLKEWDIKEADWNKFIKAGVEVFNNEDNEI